MSNSDLSPDEETPPETSGTGAITGPLWQDQDGILREMWLQNQSPKAIADKLGRSVPAIMTRAARLGLPRRSAPGRKPGRRPMDENGMPIQTTVRTPSTRSAAAPSGVIAPTTSLRICLMCLSKFESVGRHNRICSTCKGSSEYESASSLPELHVPAT